MSREIRGAEASAAYFPGQHRRILDGFASGIIRDRPWLERRLGELAARGAEAEARVCLLRERWGGGWHGTGGFCPSVGWRRRA